MDTIKCSRCNSKNDFSNSFCGQCGKSLGVEKARKKLFQCACQYSAAKRREATEPELTVLYNAAVNAITEYNSFASKPVRMSDSSEPFANEKLILYIADSFKEKAAQALSEAAKQTSKIINLSFQTLAQANAYLRNNDHISQLNAEFYHTNTLGLLANHAMLSGVSITAVETNLTYDRIYQLAEHEYVSILIEDRSEMRPMLQNMNPHVKIVKVQSLTNSRGHILLSAVGVGVNSNRHVFVTYTQNKDDFRPIRF